jgi:hypothetical protein
MAACALGIRLSDDRPRHRGALFLIEPPDDRRIGTVQEVKDRQCAVSGGMGSHVILKLDDGTTIEVHLAPTKFTQMYELVFAVGDKLEVIGSKVNFEGVDTIFAREVKRGQDDFVFRDKDGKPVW